MAIPHIRCCPRLRGCYQHSPEPFLYLYVTQILLRRCDTNKRGYTHDMKRMVNLHDLIDAHGVAEIVGLTHANNVSLYQRRYLDMPRPALNLGPGRPCLWLRPEIMKWARQTGRIE
jgi:hypothetical protein